MVMLHNLLVLIGSKAYQADRHAWGCCVGTAGNAGAGGFQVEAGRVSKHLETNWGEARSESAVTFRPCL